MVRLLSLAALLSVLGTFVIAIEDWEVPAGVIQIKLGTKFPALGLESPASASLRSKSDKGPIGPTGNEPPMGFRYTINPQGEYTLASIYRVDPATNDFGWQKTQGLSAGGGHFSVYNYKTPDLRTYPTGTPAEIFCQIHGKFEKDEPAGVSFEFGSTGGDLQGVEKEYGFIRDSCEKEAKNGITVTCDHPAACKGLGIK